MEIDRVLKPGTAQVFTDSIVDLPLRYGAYQVTLTRDGFRPLVAPVFIGRCETVELDWRLRREEEIGAEFVLVPAGSFTMGGDDQTFQSVPRSVRHVDEFAIARFPVTWTDYQEYLQAVADRSREEAQSKLPQVSTKDPDAWFIDDDGHVQWRNPKLEHRWPIMMVSHQDAKAYCEWRSERDGRVYRLPTDEEWEKAARGVDGRRFPWGSRFDASFCKNAKSTEHRAQPQPVGDYPTDCSPYGVRDMAGGIREWCDSWFDEKDQLRLVRGGSFNFGEIGARCAYRLGCSPWDAYVFIGFRLAHDLS